MYNVSKDGVTVLDTWTYCIIVDQLYFHQKNSSPNNHLRGPCDLTSIHNSDLISPFLLLIFFSYCSFCVNCCFSNIWYASFLAFVFVILSGGMLVTQLFRENLLSYFLKILAQTSLSYLKWHLFVIFYLFNFRYL